MNASRGWRRRVWKLLLASILGLLPALAAPGLAAAQGPPSADLVARGKYVFGATGGCGCHTEKGQPVTSAAFAIHTVTIETTTMTAKSA